MDLKKIVYDSLKDVEILSGVENLLDLLVYTSDIKNGDISLPCFSLAKTLRKRQSSLYSYFSPLRNSL